MRRADKRGKYDIAISFAKMRGKRVIVLSEMEGFTFWLLFILVDLTQLIHCQCFQGNEYASVLSQESKGKILQNLISSSIFLEYVSFYTF